MATQSINFQILDQDDEDVSPIHETQTHLQETTANEKDTNQYIPPEGRWRDGIFDCLNNLWPSFCCVVCGGNWLKLFYAAQISHRIGFMKLTHIVAIFIVYCLLCYLVGFITFVGLIANITDPEELQIRYTEAVEVLAATFQFLPVLFIWGFVYGLRFVFVDRYRIEEGSIATFFYSFFCSACSLCQMGRHVFGYNRLFDGDGQLDGSMRYFNKIGDSTTSPNPIFSNV